MSRRLTAAIAAASLGVGLVLGAVGAAIGGTGNAPESATANVAGRCDAAQMQAYMGSTDMLEMMGGSGMMGGTSSGMMGGSGTTDGTSSGLTSGQHAQHHGMR